jgi:hypothetical protein
LNVEPGGYWPSVARFERRAVVERAEVARVLELVGVVARVARHDEHAARGRLECDDRAALVAERGERRALARRVERGAQLLAHRLVARELVEHRADVVGLARQLVVARLLEAGLGDGDERVAHRVGEEVAGRVAARVRVARPRLRAGDERPVGRPDHAAPDALLLEQLALVELVGPQVLGLEDRPARRPADEQREEHADHDEQPHDRRVHFGALARLDTVSRRASRMKFATIDEPP